MNIFEMITLEGWTEQMYIVRDAEDTLVYDLFFVSCVIVGNFIILNLMIAVQSAYLDKAFDEEEARKEDIINKYKAKQAAKAEFEKNQEYEDEESESEEQNDDEVFDDEQSDDAKGRRRSTKTHPRQVTSGMCNIKMPKWLKDKSD